MRDYAVVASIKAEQKALIDDVFDKGYEQGYQDGKLDGEAEKIEKLEKQFDDEKKAEYKRGYADGKKEVAAELNFEKGYDKGYEDGKAHVLMEQVLKLQESYNEGYSAGYKDAYEVGKKDGQKAERMLLHEPLKKDLEEAYQKGIKHGQELRAEEVKCAEACGMKRAWEAARKVMLSPEEGGIDPSTVKEIFGMNYYAVLKNLPVDEVLSKIDAWEKKQERYCYNCGQPRDYKNSCIPYKEGKCDKSHKAWIPKQEETEKKCENCKWMELDCNNPAICKDMVLYEPKEKDVKDDIYAYVRDVTPEESKSVNDYIKSISEETGVTFNEKEEQTTTLCRKCIHAHNMHDNILTCDAVPCVIVDGHCDKYEEKQDATEINVESIAVWDEVEDNLGNRMVVTHIDNDGKYANADAINADGSFRCMPLEILEKTGRRFCFQELLNAMKKDDVEEADTNENK